MKIITTPVVDLRKAPTPGTSTEGMDPLQETQLLYREEVAILSEEGEWSYVAAPDQPKWEEGQWAPYRGWVPNSVLSDIIQDSEPHTVVVTDPWVEAGDQLLPMGALLPARPTTEGDWHVLLADGSYAELSSESGKVWEVRGRAPASREGVLEYARKWLGSPYLWGGRSPYDSSGRYSRSGIDCSSLVQLSYFIEGCILPRDAKDQARWLTPLPVNTVQLADLLFLPDSQDPKTIGHVMLALGNGQLLEASSTVGTVREVSLEQKLAERGLSAEQVTAATIFDS